MPDKISRRKMLRKGAQAALVGAVGTRFVAPMLAAEPAPPRTSVKGVDYYEKLGVTPFINAAGTYTVLSASTMPDEVQAAIALASLHPVTSWSCKMPPERTWRSV